MSGDAVTLEESLSDKKEQPPLFVDKQWLYVNDQNQGNYSGQVVVNTTSLSNNGAYIDWKESFLVIPLILQLQSTNINPTDAPLDFAMCMKSAYWQILHSLSVEYNNGSVQQSTGFLNVYSSFKNLTTWSDGDLQCWGRVCGFYPDSADSWVFNSATAADGNVLAGNGTGLSNNRIVMTVPINGTTSANGGATAAAYISNSILGTEATQNSDSVFSCANHGLLQRMKWLNFQVGASASLGGSTSANKIALLGQTDGQVRSLFKSYVKNSTTGRSITFPAVIRMKDVSDLFAKLPMVKGATMTLYINTNQCLCKFAQVPASLNATGIVQSNGSLQLTESPTILGGGGTCPFMVSSASTGQGLTNVCPLLLVAPVVGDTKSVLVGLSICKTAFSDFTSQETAPITSVRLYAPAYTMTPQQEQVYKSNATRVISYEDIFQYQFNEVNGDFNILVSNGLPGLKSIVVCPFLPSAGNGVTTPGAGIYQGGVKTSTLLSPFSSSGGTPDPIALTNFNVQISGRNIFNDAEQYDFQAFTQQLARSNQLNGSVTTGLASGLIGEEEFSNLYKYYYVDCSRGRVGEAGVSKSIQVLGRALNPTVDGVVRPVSLMIFATFTREITINVVDGSRSA